MRFAVLSLRYEARRFLGSLLAVAVSTILICLMFGVMLGLVKLTSAPIDRSMADLWLTTAATKSCDLALPIERRWAHSLGMDPDVIATDEVIMAYSFWKSPKLGNVIVIILGVDPATDSLGPVEGLSDEQRLLLSEHGAVVLDRADKHRVGVGELGATAEIFGRRVHVAGFVDGMSSISGPYVLCSLETAREVLGLPAHQTTFVVARCRSQDAIARVQARSRRWRDISVLDARQFSFRTQAYWLWTTKAGLGVLFIAGLSLVIGGLVTSQTLYTATAASVKEFAILRALGAPRWRLRVFVLQHALLVGAGGVTAGTLATAATSVAADAAGANVHLPVWLVAMVGFLTLCMANLAGLFALRVLRRTEPATLLR